MKINLNKKRNERYEDHDPYNLKNKFELKKKYIKQG
jgi:hypothetical protein